MQQASLMQRQSMLMQLPSLMQLSCSHHSDAAAVRVMTDAAVIRVAAVMPQLQSKSSLMQLSGRCHH
jgi:hypothetical protein